MKNNQDYKEILLALRTRLRGDVDHMSDTALRKEVEPGDSPSRMPIHMADIGSDAYEQEFTLSLIETEGAALEQVEEALKRIDAGTFGQCQDCGAKIPAARLNAIPYTPVCVKCAAKEE